MALLVVPGQFVGKFIAAMVAELLVFFVVAGLGLSQKFLNLLLELCFFVLHAAVAHRFVSGGVGFDFAAVQSNASEFQQPSLGTH